MSERGRAVSAMMAAMGVSGTVGWFVFRSGQPAAAVVFWRGLFGVATLLAVGAARGRLGLPRGRALGLAAAGGVALVLNWWLLFSAYRFVSIAVATIVYQTQPFMLVGLGAIASRERPSLAALASLGLALGGVLVTAWAQLKDGATSLPGVGLALGAAFFYALVALTSQRLRGTSPPAVALVHCVVAVVAFAPAALRAPWPEGAMAWSSLLALGIVHTALVFSLLYAALPHLPSALAGTLTFVYPAVAVVVDALAFGRRLSGLELLGGLIICVGVAWGRWVATRAQGARGPSVHRAAKPARP